MRCTDLYTCGLSSLVVLILLYCKIKIKVEHLVSIHLFIFLVSKASQSFERVVYKRKSLDWISLKQFPVQWHLRHQGNGKDSFYLWEDLKALNTSSWKETRECRKRMIGKLSISGACASEVKGCNVKCNYCLNRYRI